jgi:mono/diheme cytochrome c family protein
MYAKHVLAAVALVFVASAAQAQTPAQTYTSTCAACHGPTGTPAAGMVRAMGAMPDFATLRAPADSVWIRSITSGKGKMPAYGGRLNPAQIRAMVSYVKTLKK